MRFGTFPLGSAEQEGGEEEAAQENFTAPEVSNAFGDLADMTSSDEDEAPQHDTIEATLYHQINSNDESSSDYEDEEYDDFDEDWPEFDEFGRPIINDKNTNQNDSDSDDSEDDGEYSLEGLEPPADSDFADNEFSTEALPLAFYSRIKMNVDKIKQNELYQAMFIAARTPYKGQGVVTMGLPVNPNRMYVPGYQLGYSFFADADADDYDIEHKGKPGYILQEGTFLAKIQINPFVTESLKAKRSLREAIVTGNVLPMLRTYLENVKAMLTRYQLFGPDMSTPEAIESYNLEVVSVMCIATAAPSRPSPQSRMILENELQPGKLEVAINDLRKEENVPMVKKLCHQRLANFVRISQTSAMYANKYWNS